MIRNMLCVLMLSACLFGALANAEPSPNQVSTASDLLLYEASRSEALTTTLNVDAAWDTTDTIDAGYGERFMVTSFIDATNYFLRGVVVYSSGDAKVRLYGDGINCKYAADDSTTGGYVRAGCSLSLFFTSATAIDSFAVIADDADTAVDIWVMAARPKVSAP